MGRGRGLIPMRRCRLDGRSAAGAGLDAHHTCKVGRPVLGTRRFLGLNRDNITAKFMEPCKIGLQNHRGKDKTFAANIDGEIS
jgi:hypothetical protein